LQVLIGRFFGVIGKDDESINGDVELFQGIELFFVVGVSDDHVSPDFIEFSQVIDLWDDVLKEKVLGRRRLGPLILSILILLLGLLWCNLALLKLWRLRIPALFRLFDTPPCWFLLKRNS
jgi:hypothetical protein